MQPSIEHAPLQIAAASALLCLNAALLWFAWITMSAPIRPDEILTEKSWTAPSFDATRSPTRKLGEASSGDPALTKPIFFSSRKPFVPLPAATTTPTATAAVSSLPDPALVVDGIVLTHKFRSAHLRQPTELTGHWHQSGQVIDGWRVTEIDGAGIVLERGGKRFPIRLYPTDQTAFASGRPISRSTKLR